MPNFTAFMGALPPVVGVTLGVTLALLALASGVTYVLGRVKPQNDWTELRLRIRTWAYIVAGFFAAVALGTSASIIAMGLVCFVAFKEYLSVVPTRQADHNVLVWAYLAIPLQFYWVHIHWYGMFSIFIPVFVFLWLALRTVLAGTTKGFLYSVGVVHWGLMTTTYLLSHLAYLMVLPADKPELPFVGVGMLFFIIFVTELNDIFQYIWGKTLGRHKVVPNVSPKKTWEGLLGGMASTTVVVVLVGPLLTPLQGWQLWAAGPLLSLAGFAGDIVLSGVKRDIGIKDYGVTLPGHGGVLDRVDSLTFTAPLFFHFLRYFYY